MQPNMHNYPVDRNAALAAVFPRTPAAKTYPDTAAVSPVLRAAHGGAPRVSRRLLTSA